jgi:hypothetical protein
VSKDALKDWPRELPPDKQWAWGQKIVSKMFRPPDERDLPVQPLEPVSMRRLTFEQELRKLQR